MATVVHLPPVVNRSPIVTKDGAPNYGNVPVRTLCPSCRKAVMSQTTYTIGLGTWLIALVLLLLPPLCILPFFINSLKDVEHTCPNCGNLLGVKKIAG
jgi:lipopolysaccharide-induced tumor necrosis factor-alpha factor